MSESVARAGQVIGSLFNLALRLSDQKEQKYPLTGMVVVCFKQMSVRVGWK